MKKLFEFTLQKETTSLEKQSTTNEKGETTTIEKPTKKRVQQKIFLRKPGRSLYDEAELYYGVKLSEGIKAGLLTRQLLSKRFSNDGGILSEPDKDRYAALYLEAYEVQIDIEKISLVSTEKQSEETKKNLAELIKKGALLREDLSKFEMGQASLFEQTAENRARNKAILWWTIYLSHFEDEEGKITPVFAGETFDKRIARYDELEEANDEGFSDLLLRKLLYYVSFWYVGRAQSQEDFQNLLKELDSQAEPVQGEPVQGEAVQGEPAQGEAVKSEPEKA